MAKKFKHMQELKNENNKFRYMCELMNLQATQFVYENLPETIPAEFLEMYLMINGTCAIGKPKGTNELYCAIGSYNGDVVAYLPDSYTAAVVGLDEISGKINQDVVVACNNLSRTPEYDIAATVDMLCEIDISENINVIFARLSRLPIAENDKEKAQLESAIKSIIKGDPLTVASRYAQNVFDEFLAGERKEKEKFLDLVDPDKINNLQYLNQFRDNIMKRFLMRRGYMFNVTTKLAQQTNDEIHGSDRYSILYVLEQYNCRKKFVEQTNKLFGTEITVDFNPVLKVIVDNILNPPKENEDVSRETEDEKEEGAADEKEDSENGNDSGSDGNDT